MRNLPAHRQPGVRLGPGTAPRMRARNDSHGTLTSRVFLSADNRPAATLIFGDADPAVGARNGGNLKQSAVDLHLVSGDAAPPAGAVADTLGLTRGQRQFAAGRTKRTISTG
jgi:cation transport ATPase